MAKNELTHAQIKEVRELLHETFVAYPKRHRCQPELREICYDMYANCSENEYVKAYQIRNDLKWFWASEHAQHNVIARIG